MNGAVQGNIPGKVGLPGAGGAHAETGGTGAVAGVDANVVADKELSVGKQADIVGGLGGPDSCGGSAPELNGIRPGIAAEDAALTDISGAGDVGDPASAQRRTAAGVCDRAEVVIGQKERSLPYAGIARVGLAAGAFSSPSDPDDPRADLRNGIRGVVDEGIGHIHLPTCCRRQKHRAGPIPVIISIEIHRSRGVRAADNGLLTVLSVGINAVA